MALAHAVPRGARHTPVPFPWGSETLSAARVPSAAVPRWQAPSSRVHHPGSLCALVLPRVRATSRAGALAPAPALSNPLRTPWRLVVPVQGGPRPLPARRGETLAPVQSLARALRPPREGRPHTVASRPLSAAQRGPSSHGGGQAYHGGAPGPPRVLARLRHPPPEGKTCADLRRSVARLAWRVVDAGRCQAWAARPLEGCPPAKAGRLPWHTLVADGCMRHPWCALVGAHCHPALGRRGPREGRLLLPAVPAQRLAREQVAHGQLHARATRLGLAECWRGLSWAIDEPAVRARPRPVGPQRRPATRPRKAWRPIHGGR